MDAALVSMGVLALALAASSPAQAAKESPQILHTVYRDSLIGPDDLRLLATGLRLSRSDGANVELDPGWTTRGLTDPATQETRDALCGRVLVAFQNRPRPFEPDEIRRRLARLLDQLYPTRVRRLAAPAGTDVVWCNCTGVWIWGACGHACGGHGRSGVCRVVHGSTERGHGSGGLGYGSGSSSGSYSGSGRSYGSTGGSSSGYRHSGGSTFTQPPPCPTTRPAPARPSRPQPQPKPPHKQRPAPPPPPPPPPAPVVKPKVEPRSSSWLLMTLLLVFLASGGAIAWALKHRSVLSRPPTKRPSSVSDLLDPDDRGLCGSEILTVSCRAAREEDWMKAMRYLFAALLTHLVEERAVPIRDGHTNLEITGLMAPRPLWAESFWAAATVFELFWFGQRRPMENDYQLFQTLVSECRTLGRVVKP